jgi:hypothetical protein
LVGLSGRVLRRGSTLRLHTCSLLDARFAHRGRLVTPSSPISRRAPNLRALHQPPTWAQGREAGHPRPRGGFTCEQSAICNGFRGYAGVAVCILQTRFSAYHVAKNIGTPIKLRPVMGRHWESVWLKRQPSATKCCTAVPRILSKNAHSGSEGSLRGARLWRTAIQPIGALVLQL